MSSSPRHILICNERIVFRFGVDRILIELAKTLAADGWRVTFACLRCEREVVRAISPHIHIVEAGHGGLFEVEAACGRFLEEQWEEIEQDAPVDAIVCGGFPFFHVAAFGERRGVPTIFIDAGAVPHDGLSEAQIAAQRAVRRLRALSLPYFDRVLPISDFIEQSQTIPDRGSRAGVEKIPLGVDHLAGKVFASKGGLSQEERSQIERLEMLIARKNALVLSLGRFEGAGYKNSGASFLLLRELLRRARDSDGVDIRLLVLGKTQEIDVPADLQDHVICVGTPSDEALTRIMGLAHVGFSPSLWEGFNLPIGEMQILGKPVFAFNVGAHPEVILHPWFLCASVAEAAEKIERALTGRLPGRAFNQARIEDFRARFTWRRTNDAYRAQLLDAIAGKRKRERQKLLFVDVSNASRDTANSGVVRVARRLSARLQARDEAALFFVYWDIDRQDYRFVAGERENLLKVYHGPRAVIGALALAGGVEETPAAMLARLPDSPERRATLLLPEVVLDGEAANRIDWARRRDIQTAAILYDLIPIEFPQYCGEALRETFPSYVEALASTDSLIAISAYSLDCFRAHADSHALDVTARTAVAWLPGQLAALKRVKGPAPGAKGKTVSIVCVSTIEPRKNHQALLAAYRQARKSAPQLDLRLTLIGNLYRGAEDLADLIRKAMAEDPTIKWRVAIPDDELIAEIHESAFTVYPSLVEGFGLPILESLWAGKPCICHDKGVMAELAAGGGCLAVDVNDARALAAAIEMLATDESLQSRLAKEARAREISDWSDYASEISRLLWPGAVSSEAEAAQPKQGIERKTVEREAYYLRHRLNGIGLLGERTPPPHMAPEPPRAQEVVPSPAVIASPPRISWFAQLMPGRRLTIRKVRASGYFDKEWYLGKYPDVREAGIDPLDHFVKFGHREGRSPGPGFDAANYLAENPGIRGAELSPFEHFLAFRRKR
ncbi:glycosyltransferase family 4 protein [Methylocystis parvus]|uniref:Glycosyltransferase n=1 Tax=Methylocystis parvus TaxID=134 RepID=A0A6B8M1C2_9HYPH|nr:glycosyltransferase [Methylocystis parvus]QGM96092.1 glycosyltransferase [Methylocystis parvus]WBK00084.1 glycosyltransferase [Methylocystis parvus OBBP]